MRLVAIVAVAFALSACGSVGTAPSGPDLFADLSAGGGPDLQAPAPPLARFAVIGDYGVDTGDEARVAAVVRGFNPDYVVTVGDNNYPSGETATIDLTIGQHYGQYIGMYQGKYGPGSPTNRFWPCLGNHDWYSQTGAQPYINYFPALPGNRRYYDVDLGPIHLFAVDSDPHEPDGTDAQSVQATWLKGALTQSTSCFNIVTFHHPAYSSGDPMFTAPGMRWPFLSWGVDLVLMGHQHQYERLVENGLTYVVDGLGGALNRFTFATTQPGSLVRYNDDFGALLVDVYDGRLHLEFHDTHNALVDAFDVQRDCSQPHHFLDGGI